MWTITPAAAAPLPIVALGDGLVAMAPAPPVDQTVPGGWVAVLADCVEERSRAQYTVVDRAVAGESAAALAQRVGQVRELGAAWVILTLGARELADPAAEAPAIRADVEGLVAELRKGRKARPEVLLVGLVPPSLDQAEGSNPEEQQAIDARTEAWNRSLGELASGNDAVTLVDPWADWPRDPATRGALTVGGFSLSDQGQARVAAAVCDVLLASAR